MEDLSQDERMRLANIFKVVYESVAPKLSELDSKSEELSQKSDSLHKKLIKHFETKCSEQFKWILDNSEKGPNGEFNLKVDGIDKSVAQSKLKEWEVCTTNNDFGTKDFFLSIEQKQSTLQRKNESCMANCVSSIKTSNDDQIKSCLTNCFSDILRDSTELHSTIVSKISDIESRI